MKLTLHIAENEEHNIAWKLELEKLEPPTPREAAFALLQREAATVQHAGGDKDDSGFGSAGESGCEHNTSGINHEKSITDIQLD